MGLDWVNQTRSRKKKFTENKPEKDKDQSFEPTANGDMCTRVSEDKRILTAFSK